VNRKGKAAVATAQFEVHILNKPIQIIVPVAAGGRAGGFPVDPAAREPTRDQRVASA